MNFFNDKELNKWTLFLDRDGVINRRIPGGYVTTISELEFLPGSLEAVVGLSRIFNRIIIVSNQQGVGKGIMEAVAVEKIHEHLRKQIEDNDGKVDGIYFCSALASDDDPCRKPAPGMAIAAQKDFPDIDFSRSVMAGDSKSDLQFAVNLNMVPVFIESEPEREQDCRGLYSLKFPTLKSFFHTIHKQNRMIL